MTLALTDLESRLASADGVALRHALAGRAAALESRLRAAIAAGLPREQFPAFEAAANAAAAAQSVLASQPPAQDAAQPASLFASAFPSFPPR
ncbi:hypothetical protein [Bordetella genomosp. 13]|uniref:hypothetical protein n=1 Tax=Bordetella genomosp. 13 TaxID=463040 RepID=UPI0011A2B144|nr:hypothetical protein [Bordetella genomosp. 13]